jgi:type IV pilus assembly protein PilA
LVLDIDTPATSCYALNGRSNHIYHINDPSWDERRRKNMKRLGKRGFTLVEIMIVVAIIALLAAIAIPNLLRARHNANEAAAIASLRTISTAMESYRAAQTPSAYTGATLAGLSTATPPYIDTSLGSGSKQGYNFRIIGVSAHVYTAQASPVTYQTTGSRSFNVDETGVIRAANQAGWLARGTGTVIE